jgi:hypothetical protein
MPGLSGSSGMLKMGCPGSRAQVAITEMLPAAVRLRHPFCTTSLTATRSPGQPSITSIYLYCPTLSNRAQAQRYKGRSCLWPLRSKGWETKRQNPASLGGEWVKPQQSWAVALPQRYAASHRLPQLLLSTQRTLDRVSPQMLCQLDTSSLNSPITLEGRG